MSKRIEATLEAYATRMKSLFGTENDSVRYAEAAISDLAALRASHAELMAKLEKIAAWQERLASNCKINAHKSRFETMKEAYAADAKNHAATAADIRSALANAAKLNAEKS